MNPPRPFFEPCGSCYGPHGRLVQLLQIDGMWRVQCDACDRAGPHHALPSAAVEGWNKEQRTAHVYRSA